MGAVSASLRDNRVNKLPACWILRIYRRACARLSHGDDEPSRRYKEWNDAAIDKLESNVKPLRLAIATWHRDKHSLTSHGPIR